jgi:hypothetical protein
VVILGSSIFHGVELDPADSLGPQLAALLDKGEEQPCVVNLAQPGSAFENQAAALRQHAAALRPRVVVWELWGNSAYRFTMVDDAAFNFGALGLALAFGDTDPASLRIDRCCHYNEEGTRRVAQAIAAPVQQLLD